MSYQNTVYISDIEISFQSRYYYRQFESYSSPAPDSVSICNSIDIDYASIENLAATFTDTLSERGAEFIAILYSIAEKTPYYDMIHFHGSALMVDGNAYIFTAPPGTGKSTHSRLWREEFGEQVTMINDDKPMLQVRDGNILVCGTPWNGKHGLGSNIVAPLKAICFLERAEQNSIEPAAEECILPKIMRQIYRTADPIALSKTMDVIDRISENVKFFTLKCNMDPEAAHVAFDTLTKL